MKLYLSPGASSLSSHIALLEAGLPFTTEQVDIRTKRTVGGADYRAVNPMGYVPALMLDNGVVLTETAAIAQYIADLAPGARLAPPAGSLERYQLMEWLSFIGGELHKNFTPLFHPAATEDMKSAARTNLAPRFAHVARHLAHNDYLLGSEFTVADSYLFTVISWAGFVKFTLSDWPVLRAYQTRVAARPAVQQAMRAEGLLE